MNSHWNTISMGRIEWVLKAFVDSDWNVFLKDTEWYRNGEDKNRNEEFINVNFVCLALVGNILFCGTRIYDHEVQTQISKYSLWKISTPILFWDGSNNLVSDNLALKILSLY